nr:hypothetical protein [uncultured Moraxella sp.]
MLIVSIILSLVLFMLVAFLVGFAKQKPIFYHIGKKMFKSHANPIRMAGSRPYNLGRDTSFYQHFVRHTSMTEPK